ncbi:hypothetical protein DEJ49_33155 [Streptomyces venezuelae]|uniref:Secreted protein n=1 Tax=Streptomyces venezuelae TaxID=54571 RepID=A0A5P2CVQ1_STRVZ|nr:hypothetical protein DEJ49_33155 [Streptomyces venezuelae]
MGAAALFATTATTLASCASVVVCSSGGNSISPRLLASVGNVFASASMSGGGPSPVGFGAVALSVDAALGVEAAGFVNGPSTFVQPPPSVLGCTLLFVLDGAASEAAAASSAEDGAATDSVRTVVCAGFPAHWVTRFLCMKRCGGCATAM